MGETQLRIEIPASLGLSRDEVQQVSERLETLLVEVLKDIQAENERDPANQHIKVAAVTPEKSIRARPKTVHKSSPVKTKVTTL